MKLRHTFLFLASAALLAAGCGSDSDDGGKDDAKSDAKMTKAEKAEATDRDNKEEQVKAAEGAFEEDDKDVGACRNLAMSYIALASPASAADPNDPPKLPEDREENLGKAVETLEGCVELEGADRDVQQMLASSYMATNDYDKATPLLQRLARSAKGPERANAFYAWGLAASNAEQYDAAISAWQQFIRLAPADDPRIAQVRQSITALRAASRKPAATPAPAATEGDAAAAESADGAAADADETEDEDEG